MNGIFYESLVGDERQDYIEEMANELELRKLLFMLETVDKRLEISRDEAELKVLQESGTTDDLVNYYTEAEEEANEKKQGIVRRIFERIKIMIATIVGKIDAIIGRISEHVSGDFAVSRKLLQWGDQLIKIGKGELTTIDSRSVGGDTSKKLNKEFYSMSQISEDAYQLTQNNYNTISGNEYRRTLTEIKTLEIAYGKKVDVILSDGKKETPYYAFGSDYSEAVIGYHNQVSRFLKLYGSASAKMDAKFVRIIKKDKNFINKAKDKKTVKQAKKAEVEI